METKLCKHCQTEIPKKAKVCPNCQKKQGGVIKWIVIVLVALLIIGSMGSSGEETNDNGSVNNSGNVETSNDADNATNNDAEEKVDNIFSAGEYLETDYLKISYLSCQEYKSDNQFMQPKDGYSVEQTYFDDTLSATLSAGKKAKGAVYFEVPADATEVTAKYEMNYWTEEKVIFVIK